MPSPAAATHVDDEGGHGGRAHSAMKAAVFAIMAGAILWTVAAGYTRRTPAGVAAAGGEETIVKWGRRVFTAALLVPCAALLLLMSLLNCVNAAVPPPVRVRLEKALFSDVNNNKPQEQEPLSSPLLLTV